MSLLEKLRGLFNRSEIPEEAKQIFDRAETPAELLRGLDALLTRNEIEFKELDREIQKLEAIEKAETAKIREGVCEGRQKRNALLYIQRLRKQMDNYENRLRIYDRNIKLQLDLIGKIQDMEAMKLKGVDEEHIDRILAEFEESLERYRETVGAAELVEGSLRATSAKEERELAQLEAEIMGKAPEGPAAEAALRVASPEAPERRKREVTLEAAQAELEKRPKLAKAPAAEQDAAARPERPEPKDAEKTVELE